MIDCPIAGEKSPLRSLAGELESVAQVQANRQPLALHFSDRMCRCSANLLHCRSPLSLALSSASITWERIASRRRPAFSSHLIATAIRILILSDSVYRVGQRTPPKTTCHADWYGT